MEGAGRRRTRAAATGPRGAARQGYSTFFAAGAAAISRFMSPIALTDSELHEVMQAAQMVPYDLRQVFLGRLALELRGKDLGGGGLVHRIAFEVARTITWDAERAAS